MKGLKYVSWADTTGYAVAAKAYIRALDEQGVPLTWQPMLPTRRGYVTTQAVDHVAPELSHLVERAIDYDRVLIHTVPEYYPAVVAAERQRKPNAAILGYTVWELEDLPDHWPALLNQLDGVVVPCTWNRDVFRRSGVTVPIHVVPHIGQFDGVAADTSARGALDLGKAGETDRFVFYTVGHWSNRKAPEMVAEVFLRAFDADDNVSLVIKTSRNDITRWHRPWQKGFRRRHPSPKQAVADLLSPYRRAPLIEVIDDEDLTSRQMRGLHERGDCFVSLTRSEGWGLGAFEAACLGNPVIMTGYGGQRDFLDHDLAYLVDYGMTPVYEPTWSANYRPRDRWAEPSTSQAISLMQEVVADPVTARARGRALAERLSERFSRQRVTETLVEALA